ncbi:hypothetical protein GCM10007877_26950 [Marinibactrum halimedae]|uniref:Polysaccharide biosynthesis protein CapD-like domain-containing protein n=1 Tax=Marinibactrum halimedae TaxID=1444977 RepID=A0AA37WP82_9GAMM|nr:hypothetical protein GCM10007877_26950 [Marinibactrum halimedae]
MVEKVGNLKVKIQTVPTLEDVIFGSTQISDIRDVEIEDLLGRDPVPPRKDLLDKCVLNKAVMVTGAGGSIGSELCRQILPEKPHTLVLFEQNEFSLYDLERQLSQQFNSTRIVPILGSTLNRHQINETIRTFKVNTIYHAAAYKHVPIVEQNIIEGVRNNVLGTWECANAAIENKVKHFVLVSTDKAVRPTNAMGASKRIAELILQGLSQNQDTTLLSMVRFGNVLGSSGSVVPLFKKQIQDSGPITVTHKKITRFFMTIPEAAQLVIQASAMSQGGDVFVLDMGEPVSIWELAERMVKLSGLTIKDDSNPDGDIEIHQTGLRPGEKLYEELLIGDEVRGTDHPLIMRANEKSLGWIETKQLIQNISDACSRYDAVAIKSIMSSAPTDYTPERGSHDLLRTSNTNVLTLGATNSRNKTH